MMAGVKPQQGAEQRSWVRPGLFVYPWLKNEKRKAGFWTQKNQEKWGVAQLTSTNHMNFAWPRMKCRTIQLPVARLSATDSRHFCGGDHSWTYKNRVVGAIRNHWKPHGVVLWTCCSLFLVMATQKGHKTSGSLWMQLATWTVSQGISILAPSKEQEWKTQDAVGCRWMPLDHYLLLDGLLQIGK